MSVPTADRVLDCKGLLCPMPIVRLSKAIKAMQVGEVVLMEATDPGSKPDIQAWEKQTGNELLEVTEEGKVFRFLIRKAK